MLLNYKELPGKLVSQLVPNHFHQDVSDDMAARMLAVSTKYALARELRQVMCILMVCRLAGTSRTGCRTR